jgi:hypothetical protein
MFCNYKLVNGQLYRSVQRTQYAGTFYAKQIFLLPHKYSFNEPVVKASHNKVDSRVL